MTPPELRRLKQLGYENVELDTRNNRLMSALATCTDCPRAIMRLITTATGFDSTRIPNLDGFKNFAIRS